ncbi:MAG: amidohydrolase [Armatimonadota bacterium]|nr:amidohydrolase [Armatimonadota bacterium]
MGRVLIEHAAVLTCDPEDRFLADGRITIEDGRIAAVEDARQVPAGGPVAPTSGGADAVQVVDARGHIAMPGLINTHTHLWLSLLRGTADDLTLFPWLRFLAPRIDALDEAQIRQATVLGVTEALQSGTTCLCECCRYAPDLAAEVAAALGCRIVVGGMPPSEWFGTPVPHDYPQLVARTREAARRHDDGSRLVSLWLGAHSAYNCGPEFLREAKRQATAMGCDFYLHLAECAAEVDYIRERYGRTPVQYVADLGLLDDRTVAIHCVWLTEEEIRLFRQSGARMVHCPVSNAKLGSGVAPIGKYREAGIPVGLGTDSMVSNNTQSMFQEMRFAVLLQRALHQDATALTAAEALRMATIDAARVLGLEREIGSIERGKRADLVLVRSSHPFPLTADLALSEVVYTVQRDQIEAVYVEGERVVDRGRLTRVGQEALPRRGGRRGSG